ncbi:unnamed protein product [Adineta steineri]|uniref:G-protein coupled receptors family 1 profile domain-containing protein n=1 Tax=Adineta steineri TaxID=433720 RepID=A0A813ZIE1_9BILA|nr:unnamed protein product [Adineta steineri]CAF1428566.1 unnamed protein product [Adineta steineri]
MSSTSNEINQLNEAASVAVLVLSFISFVPGGIGLMFNFLIFTRPSLRREPCALYFLSSTCFSFFVVFIILPVRIFAVIFNMDMANYNRGICKIEYFALYATRATASWLIVMACIDRFIHSSSDVNIRRLSSLKTTRIAIGLTSITMIILHIHMISYYEITYVSDRFGNISPSCNSQTGTYRTFLGFWNMAVYSFCPSFFMFLFGFLTLNHIRLHHRVIPANGETHRIARRTDIQLLRMLTAQVLVIIISTLPFSINQLYSSFTSSIPKSTLRIAQENLAARIVGTTTYFAHSSSFYLYTLTGSVFRKELSNILRRCWQADRNMFPRIQNEIHPMSLLQKSQQITGVRITSQQPKPNSKIIRKIDI